MSLITAAKQIKQTVKSTRRIRLQFLGYSFPKLPFFSAPVVSDWVQTQLASGELILIDEIIINVDGKWQNFHFPQPRKPQIQQ